LTEDDGSEKYDFESESQTAWDAFHAENQRRERLQQNWWIKNPQHGISDEK
jgi:hypothetical protein